jgi:hypothetical protein
MFALIVGVAPAGIAGVQNPRMALGFHILVTWILAIQVGMTVLIYFQLESRSQESGLGVKSQVLQSSIRREQQARIYTKCVISRPNPIFLRNTI